MNVLDKVKARLFPADPESVAAYYTVLPKNIQVNLKKDKGSIIATIQQVDANKIKGLLITEAKDMDSLVINVNDLIYTYLNVPTNIRPYYGNVFKPEGYKQNAKDLHLVKA